MAAAPAATLLVVGGVGAGISTLLEQLRAYGKGMCIPGRTIKLYSTVGVDITNNTKVRGQALKVIEVGGSMISHVHRQTANPLHGVLYVIDVSNPRELPLTTIELYHLLANERLRNERVPFLVALNKSDAPSRMSYDAAVAHIGVHDLDADIDVVETSGATGDNVGAISDWIADKVFPHARKMGGNP